MIGQTKKRAGSVLLGGVFAAIILNSAVFAQSPQSPDSTAAPQATAAPRIHRNHTPKRAEAYYGIIWGVESLSAKSVESGEIVRFSWRVLDADKAKPLNDKKVDPLLIDPERGVSLVVPSLEQVGMLRQAPTKIEEGKSYWMAFSNSGRLVKPGDRVIIQIGKFRADGLIVE